MGNYAQQPKGVWEMHTEAATSSSSVKAFSINTVTGEVRKYDTDAIYLKKDGSPTAEETNKYLVMKEAK